MTFNEAVKEAVELLRGGRPVQWARLAASAGVNKDRLRGAARRRVKHTPVNTERIEVETKGDVTTVEIKGSRIVTLDDLLTHCSVDLDVWTVESHTLNKWEVGAKDANGNIVVEPLFQVKVRLVRKPQVAETQAIIEKLLKRLGPSKSPTPIKKVRGGSLLEIAVPDLHIGKIGFTPQGTTSYGTDEAVSRFIWAVDTILEKAQRQGTITEIVLPVGNDFIHADNHKNTTTAGTPQDVDGLWHEAYAAGIEALVDAIDRCLRIAPVKVVMVPGNHDRERTYYLGLTIGAYYRNHESVTIDNTAATRKYHRFGQNMIMFTHGDNEKAASLPLIMAQEAPKMWAETTYREAHMGHFHKVKLDEIGGVRLRFLPSLADTDYWHSMMGYTGNIKSAEGYLWDPETGLDAIVTANWNRQ